VSATLQEPEMNSLTTLEFASALAADGERRWLYGHPYRTEPRRSCFGARAASRRRGRLAAAGRLRGAMALFGRDGLAA
jgi:hypothetical protein